MNIEKQETISIDPADPASIGKAFTDIVRHIQALHNDVGLLSLAIGLLANAGDAGYLAQPNATRDILGLLVEKYEKDAPLSAAQLKTALAAPMGTPPPNGGTRLRIVRGEKKAA
jgi:hypothetical protein